MRHPKLFVYLAVLIVGTLLVFRATKNNDSVRGQDANIETRGNNTAGLPVATSGSSVGGFVSEAAEMTATEVALADLAQRRASTARVRQFAAELHRDHTAAGEELKALAARHQWAFPQSLDTLQAQALQALDRSQGPEFDRAFVDAMIASHQKALASYKDAAASANVPELRAFAAKHLPTLQRHLEHARTLRRT